MEHPSQIGFLPGGRIAIILMKISLPLQAVYSFANPAPASPCLQCLLVSFHRLILRYEQRLQVCLIEHEEKLRVEKTLEF